MEVVYDEKADKDLEAIEKKLRKYFLKHIEKLQKMPPRRHMKFGVPHHVEDVTNQARLVYNEEGSKLYIIRCFATHKEYERWYLSYQ